VAAGVDPAGSMSGSVNTALTFPADPRTVSTGPSGTSAFATAAVMESPAPPTTGTPAASPVAAAARAVTRPVTSVGSTTSGRIAAGRSSAPVS
jgi:hypothetical protein